MKGKVAIITDSNSGITPDEAKALGVFVVPMPLYINDELFLEDVTLSQEQFYERLKEDVDVKTSQPNPMEVAELWTEILKDYEKIVHIPMSSGLSMTTESLTHLANKDFNGKVFVVDNQRISVTMRQSVVDAKRMAEDGKTAQEIYDFLLQTKMQSSIYIMVDTLKYLKKGGRLTPAAAMIGTLLRIKPVLQIQGGKLDSFAKVRKITDAKDVMIKAMKKDFDTRFADIIAKGKMTIAVAHTNNEAEALVFKEEVLNLFPNVKFTFVDPLSLSVSCHIGPGALALACSVEY